MYHLTTFDLNADDPAMAAVAAAAVAVPDAARPRTAAARASIHDLPNELLVAIFFHLDGPSSLEPLFHEDASTLLDTYYAARVRGCRRHYPLKAASLVSRRWRAAVLPRLFKHVLWTFTRLEEPPPQVYRRKDGGGSGGDVADWFDVLAFLRRNGLGGAGVESMMLHVPCPEHLIDDPTELVGRYGLVPSSTGGVGALPPHHHHAAAREESVEEEDADSIVLSETASLVVAEVNGHATWANTWFWDMLFAVVDPLRVSFLAAPVVLATILSRKVFTRCQPLMMTRYHLLSVSRDDRSRTDDAPSDDDNDGVDGDDFPGLTTYPAPSCDNLPCELFAHRRWTALLANEGSSVSIYKSDGYGEIPPSPLLSLLGSRDGPTRRFLRRSLRRLAYVAVMPMATHVQTTLVAAAATAHWRVQELFIQVMPRGVDPHDDARFEGLEMEDLLMERDSVYGLLFASIFLPGPQPAWEPLRVFETGDAQDVVAWSEAVETVRASSACWDVESHGRFVRNLARETGRRRRRQSAELPAEVFFTPY